jgi:hypothetical protein
MLGMGAMMGATLQAPLAALLALLELTANPNIILPGMLAVVVSGITSSHLFRCESVFLTLLKARGLDYRSDPVAQSLRRVGVASLINPSFVQASRTIATRGAEMLLEHQPRWIVISDQKPESNTEEPSALLLAADLALFLQTQSETVEEELDEIDLLGIPGHRETFVQINQQATLQLALETMNEKGVDALCVTRTRTDKSVEIIGILTRQAIESHYRGVN